MVLSFSSRLIKVLTFNFCDNILETTLYAQVFIDRDTLVSFSFMKNSLKIALLIYLDDYFNTFYSDHLTNTKIH